MAWQHLSPLPGHPFLADLNCDEGATPVRFGVKFAATGDFDGDGQDELVVAPDRPGTEGDDLWAMKFDRAARRWVHMSPIPGHPFLADLNCDSGSTPPASLGARFAVPGRFSGGERAELVVAPNISGTAGNDLWVLRYPRKHLFWTAFARERGFLTV